MTITHDQLLNVVNAQLSDLEWRVYDDLDASPPTMPWLMVIGAPRCGTTLLTQLLAYCFKAGYINNIAARFWMAPVIGIRLGKEIVGSECAPGFQSKHARTPRPINIHEFGRFWTRWMPEWYADNPTRQLRFFDTYFNKILIQMRAMMLEFPGRPFVAKGIYPAYMAQPFKEAWGDKVVFINITRIPIDACLSIIRARLAKSYDGADWFGWEPPTNVYSQLLEMDMLHQVVGQVRYFIRYYSALADIEVTIEDLCGYGGATVVDQVADEAHLKIQRLPPHGTIQQYRSHVADELPAVVDRLREIWQEAESWDWC